ncbi:sulfate transporter [Legionella donaldsonii]|uniref:Sulfate transporter n=1 Tax=Legionella donaldsonii TaxID=45060 RepID=A0A378JBR0_9GAMM|nr:SulP family inorganic anion transporter [Legionella donaldsonii]STX44879.1 sulfate transporter [Legionella donaldsonii]
MFKEFKSDFMAGIIVFFVALPLCLGIALASGAPLFSGIIAGIVGGIVVGIASGSQLGVSGPAAGLAVIVLTAINTLGSWPAFLLAVILAGIIQMLMGYAKAGFIAYFFPSSVIKGMLTGIGLLIILKQIPYALGYDNEAVGDLSDFQVDGETTFASISSAFHAFTPGAILISILSLAMLILWETVLTKKHKVFELIQGPIVVVLMGIAMNLLFQSKTLNFSLGPDHLVNLPVADNVMEFFKQFTLPDFSAITHLQVWKTAIVLAIVASLETLLCVEATDKLDPLKRVTPANRELKAQGLGNLVSGLCGGLPITQVIVRSTANITFGGKTKLSTIVHGFFLLISAATIAKFLNLIPLASLAAILILIGYKLAKPVLFKQLYRLGAEQFVPFIATVVGIVATDLLKGICIGLAFGIFYTLRHSYYNAYSMKETITRENEQAVHQLVLAEEVSFFNKASIIQALDAIPPYSKVIIDCSNSKSIAYDVIEYLRDYKINAKLKNITVETIDFIEPV